MLVVLSLVVADAVFRPHQFFAAGRLSWAWAVPTPFLVIFFVWELRRAQRDIREERRAETE